MAEAATRGGEIQKASGVLQSTAEQSEGIQGMNWAKVLNSTYGPYAFGVIALMAVWFFIVKPELNTRQIDLKTHQEIVEKQREQSQTMERTSHTMKDAATIQERVVEAMGRTMERMERVLDK
jgi:hypothetical protein